MTGKLLCCFGSHRWLIEGWRNGWQLGKAGSGIALGQKYNGLFWLLTTKGIRI